MLIDGNDDYVLLLNDGAGAFTTSTVADDLERAVAVYAGNAAGGFDAPVVTPHPGDSPTLGIDAPREVVDVNDDGHADITTDHSGSGRVVGGRLGLGE